MAVAAPSKDPPGMSKDDLKKNLVFAKKEPINVAFGMDKSGKPVIMLDKVKQGAALSRQLKTTAPDIKDLRWGTVTLDQSNPKLAIFAINKVVSGGARRSSRRR